MGKKEVKGGSPKVENRCPVCGRFVKKSVAEGYKSMMNEAERVQREEIARLSDELARKQRECRNLMRELEALKGDYTAERDEVLKLKSEVYRLEHMSLWERIFG